MRRPGEVWASGGVYFIQAGSGPIKICWSQDVPGRPRDLHDVPSDRLTILAMVPGERHVEEHFLRMFRELRLRGRWFAPAPRLLALISELRTMETSIPLVFRAGRPRARRAFDPDGRLPP